MRCHLHDNPKVSKLFAQIAQAHIIFLLETHRALLLYLNLQCCGMERHGVQLQGVSIERSDPSVFVERRAAQFIISNEFSIGCVTRLTNAWAT